MRNKILNYSILFFVLYILIFNPLLQAGTYSGGDGSESTPYIIANLNDLQELQNTSSDWGKYFEQTSDIDATSTSSWDSGNGFSPIGSATDNFNGSYNGKSYTIDGLYIDRTSSTTIGFFGHTSGGTIQNLGLTNIDISGNGVVGGLVGRNDDPTLIINCYTTGSVTGNSYYVGGLVGENKDEVENCYSRCNVYGPDYTGGLIGNNYYGSTINCYSQSTVYRNSGGGTSFGGLIGSNSNTSVQYCYTTGSVYYQNADDPTSKGFVGGNYSGSYSNNFWDSQASNQTSAFGATAKNTSQMKTESTFTSVGWDFTNTWEIIGDNYPRLKDNPDPTLPVVLSAFTAQFINNKAQLYWKTQTETDNIGWNIYRAQENRLNLAVQVNSGLIDGYGTTTEPHSYLYADNSLQAVTGRTYYYWLENIDLSGQTNISGPTEMYIKTNTEPGQGGTTPQFNYGIYNIENNPFNPNLQNNKISFYLEKNSKVDLSVYNLKGQLIKKIFNGYASERNCSWNGSDSSGNIVTSGIYLYKLTVNGKLYDKQKIILFD